jgi:mono/diheme cytochrome c family protein
MIANLPNSEHKRVKTLLKVLGGLVLVVVALALCAFAFLALKKPAMRPASTEKVEATPERLARGEYLVHHASDCLGCHSDHVLTYGIPVKPGTEGQGGFTFAKEMGIPGNVTAPNITPDPETGLGRWSDGEIMRAIREGVDRDGQALFPMMPYAHLRTMSDEDVRSIVVYLRSMKPVKNQVAPRHLDFPVNYIVKMIPKPLDGPVAAPDRSNSVAYGQYLTRIGGCFECHTPHKDKGGPIEERAFSGGWEMKGPWGRNYTANLTPSGPFMRSATKEQFIARFRAWSTVTADNAPPAAKGRNTIMPWIPFSKLTDEDLGAIYDYLKTVPPIDNKVNPFPDA